MARPLEQHRAARAIALGVLGAVFFSSTFLINRQIALADGHWLWSASLRFTFTALLLGVWLQLRGELSAFLRYFRTTAATWIRWGCIGFGGFYLPLCIAAAYSPGWLVAGTFQLVLVAGLLLTPAIYTDERRAWNLPALRMASLVVCGALLMQVENLSGGVDTGALLGSALVLISTVCYPLGNRKILLFLETQPVRLSAPQVVFGMTLGSMPFWLVLSAIGAFAVPPPSPAQVAGTLAIGLFAGIVATGFFYEALRIAGTSGTLIGAVEATQSMELLATVFIEVAILGAAMPSAWGWTGSALVVLGIALYGRLR